MLIVMWLRLRIKELHWKKNGEIKLSQQKKKWVMCTHIHTHIHTHMHTCTYSHTRRDHESCTHTFTHNMWIVHPPTHTPWQAARKAQEEAELQRVREQAKFQEEMNRRKHLEDELRANQRRTPSPVDSGDRASQVERLKKIEQRQKMEIERWGAVCRLDRNVGVYLEGGGGEALCKLSP